MFHFDGIRRIQEVDVARRRVLVRADLDCPADGSGEVVDKEKLFAAAGTIRYLLQQDARVVVAAHRHNERGEATKPPSLLACGAELAALLDVEFFLPETNGKLLTRKLMGELTQERVVLLENLAYEAGERDNDESFARRLAEGFDLYVGDCLAGPHGYASLARAPKFFPDRAIGLRAEAELVALNRVQRLHGENIVLVIGGDFSEQQPLLEQVLRPNMTICVGGALASTLLAASGKDVRKTACSPESFAAARTWLQKAQDAAVKVELPLDALCLDDRGQTRQALIDELRADERIVDVGLETVQSFSDIIRKATCAVMLGAFGLNKRFTRGTRAMLEEVAQSTAFSVVLNDRDLPVAQLVDGDHRVRFGFVSTAGKAFVRLLCGQNLAGVECLRLPR